MAAINQRISNFLGGVSQQDDTLKFPGQLRVCDNAYPDVTYGLTKRPPGEFVKKLDNVTSGGYYYNIIRQKDAKYLIQITPGASAGTIKAWNLKTGVEVNVTTSGSNPLNYLAQASGSETPYAVQTIQDTTIIGNPTVLTAKSGNTGGLMDSGNYAFARCDTIAYNTEYVLWQGDTEPTPKKFRRVTSVKVEVRSNHGPVGSQSGQTFDTFPRTTGESASSGYTDTSHSDSEGNTDPAAQQQQSFAGGKGFGGELDTVPSDVTQANAPGDSGHHTVKTYKSAAGYVTLNGHSYIYQQEKTFDDDVDGGSGGDDGGGFRTNNFLGYVARYKTRYTAAVTLDYGGRYDGEGSNKLEKGDYLDYIEIEGQNADNSDAVGLFIRCNGYEEFESFEDVSSIAYYRSPENPDEGNLSMTHILKGLKDAMGNVSNVNATIVGNGLYLEGSNAPKVRFLGGTVNEGMTVFSRSTTDISRLPAQCKKGYVVRIANSENTDADNYYLKFVTDSDATVGPGKWEECARPNGLNFGDDTETQDAGFDITKMPHKLVSSVNAAGEITGFTFSAISIGDGAVEWSNREVGDMKTNPMPSFITDTLDTNRKISKIFFHRNRLALVAGEKIVLSQPGDYFNFFTVSAITNSDDNPIDIGMSDIRPAFIRHVLPVQKGIMLFSDTAQFLLFTESDIYSSKTVRLKKMSDYECDSSIEPVDLGTTVMWASTVGPYTRAFEAAIIDDGSPPKVIEQTRVIPELIPSDVTIAACSPAVGLVTYGKKGDTSLYIYKYFDGADNQRAQSAWFTWTLTGELQHTAYTAGNLYTVTKTNNEYILSRHEFVTNRVDAAGANRAYQLGSDTPSKLNTSRWFEACLDYMEVVSSFSAPTNDLTSITIGHQPADWTKIYLVVLSGDQAGAVVQADSSSSGTTAKFKIDLSSGTNRAAVGYRYETTIEFPTFYPSIGDARDLNGDLRISGVNFELGVSGPMEFNLSSIYSDISDYTLYESGMTIGTGQYSEPPAVLNKSVRVPIQRKNDKYKLQLKIPDPFSTSLLSASWDGRYNTRRHVRK